MDSKVFFSIIIPIYNVEKYLDECVQSVLNQTFTDYEIILVDDGSPDKCPQICDDYAAKNSKIHVVHKENGGLSAARNTGVTCAEGKYILFLDSDDYWNDENALQHIYNELNNNNRVDLVIFQMQQFYPNGLVLSDKGIVPDNFNELKSVEALSYMVENGMFPGSVCVMAIKREFFIINNLFFKEGIKSEDIDWVIRMANKLPKYHYLQRAFYMYRKGRMGSITSSITFDYLKQFKELITIYINYQYANMHVENCLKSYVAYQFSILMAKVFNLSDKTECNSLLKAMIPMRNILEYDLHHKVKQVNKCIRLVGFKATCRILGFYLKHRNR